MPVLSMYVIPKQTLKLKHIIQKHLLNQLKTLEAEMEQVKEIKVALMNQKELGLRSTLKVDSIMIVEMETLL
jgi:hypothetical protein